MESHWTRSLDRRWWPRVSSLVLFLYTGSESEYRLQDMVWLYHKERAIIDCNCSGVRRVTP